MLNLIDISKQPDLSKSQRSRQDAPIEITSEVIRNSYLFAYNATGNVHYLNVIKRDDNIIRKVYKEVG